MVVLAVVGIWLVVVVLRTLARVEVCHVGGGGEVFAIAAAAVVVATWLMAACSRLGVFCAYLGWSAIT